MRMTALRWSLVAIGTILSLQNLPNAGLAPADAVFAKGGKGGGAGGGGGHDGAAGSGGGPAGGGQSGGAGGGAGAGGSSGTGGASSGGQATGQGSSAGTDSSSTGNAGAINGSHDAASAGGVPSGGGSVGAAGGGGPDRGGAIRIGVASPSMVVAPAVAISPALQAFVRSCSDPRDPDHSIRGCTAAIRSERFSRQSLAILFYDRANAFHKKGQYDKAIRDFDRAIRLRPNFAPAFNNRGNNYFDKHRYVRAIQRLQ